MGMTVLIPLLIGGAVNAIEAEHRDRASCRWCWRCSGAGILRLGAHRRPAADRGQGLARGRVRPAPGLLRAPAEARARLLRQPADRPADVAGDRRPAVDPVLPRLRADLGQPERADDPVRGRRDVRARPGARAARAGARAVPGRDRDPLQPAQPPRRAGGAAADRRADRERRGEHLRDPDREGVRARAPHARPVHATR